MNAHVLAWQQQCVPGLEGFGVFSWLQRAGWCHRYLDGMNWKVYVCLASCFAYTTKHGLRCAELTCVCARVCLMLCCVQPNLVYWWLQPLEPQARPWTCQDAPPRPQRQALAGKPRHA